jgi:hypothetical protein
LISSRKRNKRRKRPHLISSRKRPHLINRHKRRAQHTHLDFGFWIYFGFWIRLALGIFFFFNSKA